MNKIFNKIRSARTQLSKLYAPALTFARSVLIASAAVTLSLIGARQLGILQSVELGAYDQMLRWRPEETPDSRLLIVGITEGDIQRLKQWPISDRKVAEILQKLEKMQPRTIGLDILRDVPLGDGRAELTKVLQKSDRIIGVCLVSNGSVETPGSPPAPGLPSNRIGYADFGVDTGGVLRRALLFMKPPKIESNSPVEKHLCNDNSQIIASFNLQLALHYLKAQGITGRTESDQSLWLGETQLTQLGSNDGAYKNADVRGYQILINYRSRRQVAKQVTLTDVLEGKIDPNLVKDKIVLIGYTTETVKDFFYTPYSAGNDKDQLMFGIVAHAQVVSQILSAVLDKRPMFWFWPKWVEILWISAWSIVGGILAGRMTHPARLALTFGAMLGVCCSISFGIFMLGGWIPVAAPALALLLTGGGIVSADRFQKSGYGEIISKQVQKVKQAIIVHIDQAKKEEEVNEVLKGKTLEKVQEWKKRKHKRDDKKEPYQTETSQLQEITFSSQEPENAKIQPEKDLAQLSPTDESYQQPAKVTQATVTPSERNSQTSVSIDASNSHSSAETSPDEEIEQVKVKADFDKRPLPEWIEILWLWGWSIIDATSALQMAHPRGLALAFAATLGISFGIFMLGGWGAVAATALALIVTGGSIVSGDRFNPAEYGKVISDWVKQVFKIEIDQAKTEEQVQTTQSEGFNRSKEQMEGNKYKQNGKKEPPQTEPSQPQEIIVSSQEPENAQSQPEEYLALLAPTAELHQQPVAVTLSESESQTRILIDASNSNGSASTSLGEEMDRLKVKAEEMRRRRGSAKSINKKST
ncbi:MAG: CHASE2 domain-containing protein [Microcoleus sp. CSU_2_2]|nr:CHASE2 domain-containing protein [Microcoleus sp. SU_5_3]NJS11823.1 CHASE2 domain-containing protein [Microcoleus sp. CSU_2_2]